MRELLTQPWFYQSLGAFVSTCALCFSIYALLHTSSVQRQMKTIDLMRSFQERYDRLEWVESKAVHDEDTAKRYFARYWNLQLEQYEYWKQGFIDDKIFAYW